MEVFLALSIAALISVIGFNSFSNLNTDKALEIEAEKTISLIAKARALTLSAKEEAAYGVHFEERKTVLFKGASYSTGASGNQVQLLSDAVKISAVALTGGGSEVHFKRLTGTAAQSGTITLASVRDDGKTKVITIAVTGVAF